MCPAMCMGLTERLIPTPHSLLLTDKIIVPRLLTWGCLWGVGNTITVGWLNMH